MKPLTPLILLVLLLCSNAVSQRDLGVRPTSSGGPLQPEQAAYDVVSYDLALAIDPASRRIEGVLTMLARIVHPVDWIVLDLDSALSVDKVERSSGGTLRFDRRENQLWIELRWTHQAGEEVGVAVSYGGVPREAPRPPWVGGFVWSATADGRPWIGVACQQDGADLWWPNKDHVSDKPDSMKLHFRVPEGLTAVSNGQLRRVEDHGDGTRTFHWDVSNPISAYNVTLNVAPYLELRHSFTSRAGDPVNFHFWALPESRQQAEAMVPHFIDQFHFLEELLGPYPFRHEKYGVVQTSYLGMEHQTAISYGSTFEFNDYGFDWLHLHELAHEWWGNQVTVADWRDFWIHEGFASYMEALYAERLQGSEGLHRWMAGIRHRLRNELTVAPRHSQSTIEKYFVPPDYTRSDGDVNYKGSWILHTLRWTVGDEIFFRALRRFSYPSPQLEQQEGCACRFATTDDFRRLLEQESGGSLSWFFDLYLRQPALPSLKKVRNGKQVTLEWVTPDDLPFPMPIEIIVDGERRRIEMPRGKAELTVDGQVEIDPDGWVLKEERIPKKNTGDRIQNTEGVSSMQYPGASRIQNPAPRI